MTKSPVKYSKSIYIQGIWGELHHRPYIYRLWLHRSYMKEQSIPSSDHPSSSRRWFTQLSKFYLNFSITSYEQEKKVLFIFKISQEMYLQVYFWCLNSLVKVSSLPENEWSFRIKPLSSPEGSDMAWHLVYQLP